MSVFSLQTLLGMIHCPQVRTEWQLYWEVCSLLCLYISCTISSPAFSHRYIFDSTNQYTKGCEALEPGKTRRVLIGHLAGIWSYPRGEFNWSERNPSERARDVAMVPWILDSFIWVTPSLPASYTWNSCITDTHSWYLLIPQISFPQWVQEIGMRK